MIGYCRFPITRREAPIFIFNPLENWFSLAAIHVSVILLAFTDLKRQQLLKKLPSHLVLLSLQSRAIFMLRNYLVKALELSTCNPGIPLGPPQKKSSHVSYD